MRLCKSLVVPLLFVGVLGAVVGHTLTAVTPLDIRGQVPRRFVFGPTVEEVVETLSPGRPVDESMISDPIAPEPGNDISGPAIAAGGKP